MARWALPPICLWPGLPSLWGGRWSGLLAALAFALLLNGFLLCSLVWTAWVSPATRLAMGITAATWWLSALWLARRRPAAAAPATPATAGDLFPDALGEYLQGHWLEAERMLQALISRNPRDAEARLLLATLWRRTRRPDEAKQGLADLRCLEEAVKWEPELEEEARRLQEPPGRETVQSVPLIAASGDRAQAA